MGWGEQRLPLHAELDARVQMLNDLLVAAKRGDVGPTAAADAVLRVAIEIAADVADLPDNNRPLPAWLANELEQLTR